jgi:alpha-tubulin suppressor-like RCC1 family protein
MDLLALRHRSRGFYRRASGLVLMVVIAALMTIAAPASATSYGATAWGHNGSGQLGTGTYTNDYAAVAVSGVSGVTALSGGGGHSLALLGNQTVMAWGDNSYGQLGDGTTEYSDVPVAVSGLSSVTAISAGGASEFTDGHSLALLSNGTVMSWGANEYGQLGTGMIGFGTNSDVSVAVSGLTGVTAIGAGGYHSLALMGSGKVVAWGQNYHGQLGNGSIERSDTPLLVGGVSGVTAIAAGEFHSLALLSNGTVMAWGANEYGQLGDGTTTERRGAVAVSGLKEVTAIAAGGGHSLALLSNGTVMAWGGTTTESHLPVAVSGLKEVTAIAAGGGHSLALLGNGTVMAWGANEYGQLGNHSTTYSETPVPVDGLTAVVGIAAGWTHSLAFGTPGPPAPTVTSLSPNSGPQAGGTSVSIIGTNLTEATAVRFGTHSAASYTVNSNTSITAVAPAASGTVDVTVTIPAGTSSTSLADQFSYVPPVVTKLAPQKGPLTGGTVVKLTGTNFIGINGVKFGPTNATSFTVKSATLITAVSPSETAAGRFAVTVTTPGGTSAFSYADYFKYSPTVTGLSPNTGSKAGGTSVTISGAGFALGTSATIFRFGTTKATKVNCTSTTQCTAVAPAHAVGTVDVKAVVDTAASVKNAPADQFTYN